MGCGNGRVGGLGVEDAPVGVKAANARVKRRSPRIRAARVVPQVDPGERVICWMFVLGCGLRLRLERRALHGEALDAGRDKAAAGSEKYTSLK